LIVARHFSGGYAERIMRVPEARLKMYPRLVGQVQPSLRDGICGDRHPAINRWATLRRPYGARHNPDRESEKQYFSGYP
jgi:hypothetical protein